MKNVYQLLLNKHENMFTFMPIKQHMLDYDDYYCKLFASV